MTALQPTDSGDSSGEPRSFDLRDYWQIIRRRAMLVVALTIIGAVAGVGYAVSSGHSYSATAQVLVTLPNQAPGTSSSAEQLATQANMTTEQTIAQSPPVVLRAARLLHLQPTALQQAAAKGLTVNVPATTLATSNLLQFIWRAKSSAAAQAGANAFASAYLAYRGQVLASQTKSSTASLDRRLALVQQQYTHVHSQLKLTPTRLPLHQSLALKLRQLNNEQVAINNRLASLALNNNNGGSLIPATRPLGATGLSHKVIVVLGALLGLLIGLVLAFVRDIFDDRIRDAAQLEQKLGAPVLAVVSPDAGLPNGAQEARRGARQQRPSPSVTVTSQERQSAGAVRTLRTMLAATAARRQMVTLLVVAADASVSAGQLAAELGMALAESGRRVLLVAADLRGSALPQIFHVPNKVGLSDLLSGGGGDPEVVMHKPHGVGGMMLPGQAAQRLTVLPPGPQRPQALAVLDSDVMQRLLHDMREAYDFVLLDSPPATAAADVYALAANVDGVLVAARTGHARGRAVRELSARLDRIGAVLVGGVLIGKDRVRGHRQWRRATEPPDEVELPRSAPLVAVKDQRARL